MNKLWQESRGEIIGGLIVATVLAIFGWVSSFFLTIDLLYLLIFLAAIAWLICLYITFKRDKLHIKAVRRRSRRYKGPFKYPRLRPWTIACLIIIPLLIIVGISYQVQKKRKLSEKIIVLIADFDGPNPKKYGVTDAIFNRLGQALATYGDVEVVFLGEPITEAQGSSYAREKGNEKKSDIVIWGWYRTPGETVALSMHFELMDSVQFFPGLCPAGTGEVRQKTLAQLESFSLQTDLSKELAYLSLFVVGMTRYSAQDWEGAIGSFNDALSQTSNWIPSLNRIIIYFYRGLAYAFQNNTELALADFDRVIGLYPSLDETLASSTNLALVYHNRGVEYHKQGKLESAISDFEKTISLDPNFILAYINRGEAYKDQGNLEAAIDDFNKAIKIDGNLISAYYERGEAYRSLGNTEAAIADFNKALELGAATPCVYNARGLAQEDVDASIEDFNTSLELDENFVIGYVNRAVAYKEKGNLNAALADYRRAIEIQPDSYLAYYNRGNLYKDQGDLDSAFADYNEAIELNPDFFVSYLGRGNVYLDREELDMALADYDRVIELRPDFSLAYYSRGIVYQRQNKNEQAIADFERFLELHGDTDSDYKDYAEWALEHLKED